MASSLPEPEFTEQIQSMLTPSLKALGHGAGTIDALFSAKKLKVVRLMEPRSAPQQWSTGQVFGLANLLTTLGRGAAESALLLLGNVQLLPYAQAPLEPFACTCMAPFGAEQQLTETFHGTDSVYGFFRRQGAGTGPPLRPPELQAMVCLLTQKIGYSLETAAAIIHNEPVECVALKSGRPALDRALTRDELHCLASLLETCGWRTLQIYCILRKEVSCLSAAKQKKVPIGNLLNPGPPPSQSRLQLPSTWHLNPSARHQPQSQSPMLHCANPDPGSFAEALTAWQQVDGRYPRCTTDSLPPTNASSAPKRANRSLQQDGLDSVPVRGDGTAKRVRRY